MTRSEINFADLVFLYGPGKDLGNWVPEYANSLNTNEQLYLQRDILEFYALLELAVATRYINDSFPAAFRERSLRNSRSTYGWESLCLEQKLVAPLLFAMRLHGRPITPMFNHYQALGPLMMTFLTKYSQLKDDAGIRAFQSLLSSGISGQATREPIFDFFTAPLQHLPRLLDSEFHLEPELSAAIGFWRFLEWAVEFDAFLRDAPEDPLLRGLIWHTHWFTFQVQGPQLLNVARRLSVAIATDSVFQTKLTDAEDQQARNASKSQIRLAVSAIERLVSPVNGSHLRRFLFAGSEWKTGRSDQRLELALAASTDLLRENQSTGRPPVILFGRSRWRGRDVFFGEDGEGVVYLIALEIIDARSFTIGPVTYALTSLPIGGLYTLDAATSADIDDLLDDTYGSDIEFSW
jgi:hypothetical protein